MMQDSNIILQHGGIRTWNVLNLWTRIRIQYCSNPRIQDLSSGCLRRYDLSSGCPRKRILPQKAICILCSQESTPLIFQKINFLFSHFQMFLLISHKDNFQIFCISFRSPWSLLGWTCGLQKTVLVFGICFKLLVHSVGVVDLILCIFIYFKCSHLTNRFSCPTNQLQTLKVKLPQQLLTTSQILNL